MWVLPLFLLFFSIINLVTLYNGHNWGGDFAQYILHAQNLIEAKPYNHGIMLENTISYPPGFPLLLAPIIKSFGLDFIALKSMNIFFWYGSLLFLFHLLKDRTSRLNALLCTSLLASSSFFFVFKQNVLSDVPFTFFCVASLYFFERKRLIPALIFLFFSILSRSSGLMLCASVILYFTAIQKDLRLSLAAAGAAAAALIIQSIINPNISPGFFRQLTLSPIDSLIHLMQGSPVLWQSLCWFFCPGQTPLTSWIFSTIEAAAIILSPLIYIGIGIWVFKTFKSHSLGLIELFCVCYLGMLAI